MVHNLVCSQCNGKRKIMLLGGFYEDCTLCDGKGIIKNEDDLTSTQCNPSDVLVSKKRAGRPKKWS